MRQAPGALAGGNVRGTVAPNDLHGSHPRAEVAEEKAGFVPTRRTSFEKDLQWDKLGYLGWRHTNEKPMVVKRSLPTLVLLGMGCLVFLLPLAVIYVLVSSVGFRGPSWACETQRQALVRDIPGVQFEVLETFCGYLEKWSYVQIFVSQSNGKYRRLIFEYAPDTQAPPPQFSRTLDGVTHISFDRLARIRLAEAVWRGMPLSYDVGAVPNPGNMK